MPKVRASSATMGTTRGPSAGPSAGWPSMRTKAIVVLISLPSACSAKAAIGRQRGTGSAGTSAWRAAAAGRRARRGARAGSASRGCRRAAQKRRAATCSSLSGSRSGRGRRCSSARVELLLLVRGHAALADRAHAVALHGLGQHHGGLARVRPRRGVGGVDLHQVVAAAVQAVDLVVAHGRDQRRSSGPWPKKLLAVEGAVVGAEGLELAVDGAREGARQGVRAVAREQPSQSLPHSSLMTFQPAPANRPSRVRRRCGRCRAPGRRAAAGCS
jgi:hypothetical protein